MVWVRLNLSIGKNLVVSDSYFILVIQLHAMPGSALEFSNFSNLDALLCEIESLKLKGLT